MWETDHRPLLFAIILGMMCIVAIAVAAHLVIRKAVRDLVATSVAKQLLADAENMRLGRPLRALRGDPATTNRKLLAALNRV